MRLRCGACIVLAFAASSLLDPANLSAAPASKHRALLIAADGGTDPLARCTVALALADTAAAWAALERSEGWEPALRDWLRGRLLMRRGDVTASVSAFGLAAEHGTLQREPLAVARLFDRERLQAVLAAKDLRQAQRILDAPIVDHGDDPLWSALQAQLWWEQGEAARAARAWNQAWSRAPRSIRADPLFAGRATALLASQDTLAAARAWTAYVGVVSRPDQRKAALREWDRQPHLAEAVSKAHRWIPTARWLSRNNRREEALELLIQGWRQGEGRMAARCFVRAAEQFYRLRRHDELAAHLKQPWPTPMNREELASLEAYPWGVARRKGDRREAAQGFDAVAMRYAGTARAGEAIWESAWMWELSGDLSQAQQRYMTYVQRYPRGPYAAGAALRAIYLPYVEGDHQRVLDHYRRTQRLLGRSLERAGGEWIRGKAQEHLGQETQGLAKVKEDHANGPFARPIAVPFEPAASGPGDAIGFDADIARLFQLQQKAFAQVALHLGGVGKKPADIRAAERLLQLGIREEADRLLAAHSSRQRRDALAQLRVTRAAWRGGHPERQARAGYQLRLLLRGESEELDMALDRIAFPTPYAAEVMEAARQEGLSASLLWSLMRRESFYDAEVSSMANAHGLMQLLPKTGAQMAAQLGDPEPTVSDLHRPLLNLRYGSHYLKGVLSRAQGNLYQALASYNAGETNGRRWRERLRKGAPDEEIVLNISYTETRGYVYHILRMWALYDEMYPALAMANGNATP